MSGDGTFAEQGWWEGYTLINIEYLSPEDFIEVLCQCPKAMDDSYNTYLRLWDGDWHSFILEPKENPCED